MIKNLTPEEQERVNEIIEYLRSKSKSRKHYGQVYFSLNDYLFTLSIFITIFAPIAFAILIYYPESDKDFNVISLIVSSIGVLVTILRALLRLRERSIFNIKKRNELDTILNKILFDTITKEELIELMDKSGSTESDDPQPE